MSFPSLAHRSQRQREEEDDEKHCEIERRMLVASFVPEKWAQRADGYSSVANRGYIRPNQEGPLKGCSLLQSGFL